MTILHKLLKFTLRKFGVIIQNYFYLEHRIDKANLKEIFATFDYSDVKELVFTDFLKGEKQVFTLSKLRLIQKRLDSDKFFAYGIIKDDVLVYSTWVSFDKLNFNSNFKKKIDLRENEALLEDSYCHKNYRGNGYHGKMNIWRLDRIAKKDRDTVVVLVERKNTPALKVQKKSGFRVAKKIKITKIWGREYYKEELCS